MYQRTTIVRADIKQQMRVVLDQIHDVGCADVMPQTRSDLVQHRQHRQRLFNDTLFVIYANTVRGGLVMHGACAPSGAAATSL